jgi:zinc transport system ATP-binding protein
MQVISLENINVSINNNLVLEEINLSIQENEFIGIIGPNGGGKTTLLKVMLGLVEPASGKVLIFNKPPEQNRKFIGYLPQQSNFSNDYPISVKDVVLTARLGSKKFLRRFSEEDTQVVDESLSRVGLFDYRERIVGELSGGEKQKVLIARALSTKPKILLLDEPTANIDTKTGKSFYDLLNQLNEEITIIMVSHDIGAVSQYVKKIACLNKKLVFHDSKEITKEMLEETYHCPIDLIAHGIPHRVFDEH